MSDAVHQANLVQRRVSVRMIESQWARTTTMSRVYAAPVDEVWDACTNPERISRWFLPVSGDLHLGGRYQLEGNAGGTIEACDRPNGFTATWEHGGDVSWIEVRLLAEPAIPLTGPLGPAIPLKGPLGPAIPLKGPFGPAGGTRFELEHIAHVTDARWAEFGPGATGVGWDLGLLSLARHLDAGADAAPTDDEAWMASDEGREFMTLSSWRWCQASIAAGTNPAEAEAAAARTTAAYAGEG